MNQSGSELFIVDNSDVDWKVVQYLRDWRSITETLDIAKAYAGLDRFREALGAGKYDMIILDEINVAVSFGLLEIEDVLAVLASRPKNVHVVLTGRNAHEKVVAMDDLVTEMREIKHPFQKHIKAQKGIEF